MLRQLFEQTRYSLLQLELLRNVCQLQDIFEHSQNLRTTNILRTKICKSLKCIKLVGHFFDFFVGRVLALVEKSALHQIAKRSKPAWWTSRDRSHEREWLTVVGSEVGSYCGTRECERFTNVSSGSHCGQKRYAYPKVIVEARSVTGERENFPSYISHVVIVSRDPLPKLTGWFISCKTQ